MNKKLKVILKALGPVVALFLLALIVYVAYLFLSYHRIEDNQELSISKPQSSVEASDTKMAVAGEEYTIGTYNVGFGAYLPDYSFFMDGGKYSRCYSKQSGIDAINGAANLAMSYEPDFMMFQEVDLDATRSWHVNQDELISDVFNQYYESFAVNYDSAYLFYPFNEPIGKSKSGISLYSKYEITSSLRRSLPISTSLTKFLDLDRCYSVSRVDVKKGEETKELVIFTVHLSAYGNSDEIREGQLSMLFEDMQKELDAGNYIICGGDFNHDLKAEESDTENRESWAYPFPRSKMPEGLSFAMDKFSAEDIALMAETNRNTDTEYIPGESYVCTLDGFIISDNIEMLSYGVEDTGFLYADHQPVFMRFRLAE